MRKRKLFSLVFLLQISMGHANPCLNTIFEKFINVYDGPSSSPYSDMEKSRIVWNEVKRAVANNFYAIKGRENRLLYVEERFKELYEICYKSINENSNIRDVMKCYSFNSLAISVPMTLGKIYSTDPDAANINNRLKKYLEVIMPKECVANYVGGASMLDIYIYRSYLLSKKSIEETFIISPKNKLK